jgi:hypothetical protein
MKLLHPTFTLVTLVAAFIAVGGLRIGALGIPAEEVLPHLFAHPHVVARESLATGQISLLAPYDGSAGAERSGVIASPVWPTLSVVRPPRSYPILAESWQAAYLSYYAAAVAPVLGGGIEGLRRSGLLLGAAGLVLVAVLARKLARDRDGPWLGVVAAAWLATSMGYLFVHRLAYLIESAPPLVAALAVLLALDGRASRWILAGLAAGAAVALKATTAWVLLAMLLFAFASHRVPAVGKRAWAGALVLALVPLVPAIVLWRMGGVPNVVASKASLLAHPLEGLARAPRVAWIAATFLSRPTAILSPVLEGKEDIAATPWSAAVPVLLTLYAVARVRRRRDDRDPELAWIIAAPIVVVLGALMYGDRNPVQLALLVAPLYAIVAARALFALGRTLAARVGRARSAVVLGALAVAVQGGEIAAFVGAHRTIDNPMMAMQAQRELASTLVARGIEHPLTTTYNAVGVFEFLSEGRVTPLHLYPMLMPAPGVDAPRARAMSERAFRIALSRGRDRSPVVLSLGHNVFEGGRENAVVVRDAFFAACRTMGLEPREVARFPAAGTPMLGLYEATGDASGAPAVEPVDEASLEQEELPASASTRATLGGLAPGTVLGVFVVDSVSEPVDGAVIVRARSDTVRVAFELRLDSEQPLPPVRSGPYAIYFRGPTTDVPRDDLFAAARALGDILARAPPGTPPLRGLTTYKPSPR